MQAFQAFLINATGPKLNFQATPGLGPGKHTTSVCSYTHAVEAWKELQISLERMEKGEKQRFLIGVGHATATCQGAGFEYALNVAFEINKRKLNHLAEITFFIICSCIKPKVTLFGGYCRRPFLIVSFMCLSGVTPDRGQIQIVNFCLSGVTPDKHYKH